MGPRTAPKGKSRASLYLSDAILRRSPVLNIIAIETMKRVSSKSEFVRLLTSMFSAPIISVERGQKSWVPPVKKSPISE